MSYRIQSGDTLSALAQRYGTSVDSLMKANPQITNKDLIYAGKTLNIPGSRDSFESGSQGVRGGGSSAGANNSGAGDVSAPPGGAGPATRGPGGSPFDIAVAQLGKNAGSLKLEGSGVGADMEDWVPNNVNCANFVSACLEQAGQIKDSQHSASVMTLQANLDRDPNFQRVSLKDAKPGDVVSMKVGSGQHVVMFAGWKDGKAQFIGSNNINSDGSQRISYTSMNYPIMSVHQYRG
ncbi:LysM domain-containing protein [Corallococcus sp. AB049A]|uniref:LysM domain-containing protein n=1 Tax=Corallococcus interemptor TaxID=2316720 RepID=A0A3A8QNN4_9BACT|nr:MULTISPECIES: LysM domain-containing protein [Corallococcus]RKH50627.1 LysM domain-containing protein [Corallococcus sp. AB050B]RKH64794.1 LysM domain-containing protein [Corallococcus interemptor]RKI68918.1 LysM domain-containing protein [Corallococcus sp. AB049A]